MKFAEMTQEVHITRSNPVKLDLGFTPGRRHANKVAALALLILKCVHVCTYVCQYKFYYSLRYSRKQEVNWRKKADRKPLI